MADFVSSHDNPPILPFASSSGAASAAVDDDDDFEDSCSICLEPFNSQDPPTVTNCRHEYHLQCILDWSQRSKECPICWQILVLKDPASQELLSAVENERNLRSRPNARHIHQDYGINHDNSYSDESDFEEHIMQHFAAAAHRARYINRRERRRSSGTVASQVLHSVTSGDLPLSDVRHMRTPPEERRNSNYEFLEGDSPTSSTITTIRARTPPSVVSDVVNTEPYSVGNRQGCPMPSQLPPESPQRPSTSEFLAFSDSIKSKFSAASARYKESMSKFTQEFKEKQLVRKIAAKEVRIGVQREINASIAGVARMIERLDLTSKRTGVSVPLSSCPGGPSNFSYKGKDMKESEITESSNENAGETAHGMSSAAPPCVRGTIPGPSEAPLVQSGK